MTRSEKKKQSYKLGHNRQKTKPLVLRVNQLKINGMYTALLGFFMSLGIEVNTVFLIIYKKF